MNKCYLLACLLFLIAFLPESCDMIGKKDVLEVDADTLRFPSDEQKRALHITSNGAWHILGDPQSQTSFCSFSPESGEGDSWVMVAAERNGTFFHRTEDIIIRGEGVSKKLTIAQAVPLPVLADGTCRVRDWSGASLSTLPADGGTIEITGFHFGIITFRCDNEDVSVDTLSRKPGYHNYKAFVRACPTAEGRTIGFFLTLTTESGELTEPFFIEQDGGSAASAD